MSGVLSELASQQHATHMRDVTGPVHTGSGDIIYPTSPLPSLPLETELFLALDRWWESIKDYELSMGELGSASEANVLPQDNGMAIQLEHFRISKIRAWPFLDEETRNAFDQTEGVFLGFRVSGISRGECLFYATSGRLIELIPRCGGAIG